MTSKLLGRAVCNDCGFESAHVKENPEKGTLYLWCPEHSCRSQMICKTPESKARLLARMRPEGVLHGTVAPAPATALATAPVAPPAPATGPVAAPIASAPTGSGVVWWKKKSGASA